MMGWGDEGYGKNDVLHEPTKAEKDDRARRRILSMSRWEILASRT